MKHRFLSLVAPFALLTCSQAASAAVVEVVKSPTCGCCSDWVEHLRRSGFQVRVTEVDDTSAIARKLGVPDDLRSCHTARVGGYAVEGHVPAADIRLLLAKKPAATGIAVPGMPMGSPGMDRGSAKEAFATILFGRKGKRQVFARH
jgi:hypothetical protein